MQCINPWVRVRVRSSQQQRQTMLAPSALLRHHPGAVNRINCVTAPSQPSSTLVQTVGAQLHSVSGRFQMLSATPCRTVAPSRMVIARSSSSSSSSLFSKFSHQAIRIVVLAQQEARVDGFTGSPSSLLTGTAARFHPS